MAKCFSKLDANHGYWQIPLDPESQLLTTFNSPFGRYCFRRMPFGVKSAQEIFQKRTNQNFGDLLGVETDIDDIFGMGVIEWRAQQTIRSSTTEMSEDRSNLKQGKVQVWCIRGNLPWSHYQCWRNFTRQKRRSELYQRCHLRKTQKGVERLLGVISYVGKFTSKYVNGDTPNQRIVEKGCEGVKYAKHTRRFQQQLPYTLGSGLSYHGAVYMQTMLAHSWGRCFSW